jgi:glutathione peroxidase
MKRKHFFFGTVALILLFSSYVMYVNRNSKNMTIRQKILKAVYPALMALSGKKAKSFGNQTTPSPVSFYSLQTTANSGSLFNFSTLQGKKVLIVNGDPRFSRQ